MNDIPNGDVIEESKSWTKFERQIRLFRYVQCRNEGSLKFYAGIKQAMRDSTLGCFLYHLNSAQRQTRYVQRDKLDRIRFDIDKKLENLEKLRMRNYICDDLLGFIEYLLEGDPTGKITVKTCLKKLDFLRLTGSKISAADDSFHSLSGLHGLVLAGNCLPDFRGGCLSRSLQLLELCYNNLQSLDLLLQDCPPGLLYLGLARNFLTQDTIQPLTLANNLYHLDLADNDIEDLVITMDICSQLTNLSSLLLAGNPCSMIASYSDIIVYRLPKIIFLDGEMLKKQNEAFEDNFDFTGTLQLTMFRIMSMPQPPNQKINKKKVKHTLRIEMYCPQLQSYIPEREEDFIEDFTLLNENTAKNLSDEKKGDQMQNEIKNKGKNTNKTDQSTAKKSKSGEPDGAKCVEGDPLYEAILKENQPDTKLCFVSEQKSWGKIIEFSDPTIEVSVRDLVSLRNVFRSNLRLRVVHLKTLPPPIKKKKNKQKAKRKQGSLEETNSDMDSNKEILVSKSTIAVIKIPLQNIFWSVKSLDYTWSITKPSKVDFTPGLKDLQYSSKKKKTPKKAKGKEEVSTELQIPDSFTCHIGIGLKRV